MQHLETASLFVSGQRKIFNMRVSTCVLVATLAVCLPIGSAFIASAATLTLPPTDSGARTWTDATGRFHTEAVFIDGDSSHVRLQKLHGSLITVPLARLSEQDRQFVAHSLRVTQSVSRAFQPDKNRESDSPPPAANNESSWLADLQSTWSNLAPSSAAGSAMSSARWLLAGPAAPMPENMLYIRLSAPFLQRMIAEPFARQGTIDDVVLGSKVGGTSHTSGIGRAVLLPSEHDGEAIIQLFGTTNYNSIADAGPITVFTSGITQFASAKALRIDGSGIQLGAAATNAQTSSVVTGVTTSLPGLRGRIALRIGSRRAQESRAVAAGITSQHTALRINHQFDLSAGEQIDELCQSLGKQLAALPANHLLRQCRWQASSTADDLQIVMLAPTADKYQRIAVPALANPDSSVEVQVHASLVRFALTDGDLHKLLRPVTVRLASLQSSADKRFDLGPPSIQWSTDRKWLSLTWPARPTPPAVPKPQAPTVASR